MKNSMLYVLMVKFYSFLFCFSVDSKHPDVSDMLLDFQLNRDVPGTHAGKQTLRQVSGFNHGPTHFCSSSLSDVIFKYFQPYTYNS